MMRLSMHFDLEEFTVSARAAQLGIDNTPDDDAVVNLIALCGAVLEPIRSAYGKPITITSGYRCQALEKVVSGVTRKDRSQHMTGNAADFVIHGIKCNDIFQWVMNNRLPYDQLIFEKNLAGAEWIHISHVANAGRRMSLLGIEKNAGQWDYIHITPETYV